MKNQRQYTLKNKLKKKEKENDFSNETLIETFDIFQINKEVLYKKE